jgi:hypothetical protein
MRLQKINPVIRGGRYSAHKRNPTTSSSGIAAFAFRITVGSLLKLRSLIVDPKVLIMNAEGSGNAVLLTGGSSHKSRSLTLLCSLHTDSGDPRSLRALGSSSSSEAASTVFANTRT